jgi:hypothetical protein
MIASNLIGANAVIEYRLSGRGDFEIGHFAILTIPVLIKRQPHGASEPALING